MKCGNLLCRKHSASTSIFHPAGIHVVTTSARAVHNTDIEHLIQFYAQKAVEPLFDPLEEIERKKLDASEIAKRIYDEDMRRSERNEYINQLWNEDGSVIPV